MNLSIIIPMYNSSKYLHELFSTLSSFDPEYTEIIIIDDGSNDDTFAECIKFKNGKENVSVYHHENNGVSFSRNFGIDKAKGKYIMFLDSDDLLENKWEEVLKIILCKNWDEDMLIFSNSCVDHYPDKKDLIDSIVGISTKYSDCYLQTPWSKIYNRDFLKENSILFNKKVIHGEDALFNIECIIYSKKVKMINNSFYKYRINNGSVTHNYNQYFLNSNVIYLNELALMLKKSNLFDNETIDEYIAYSYQNSIYILVGKISKIKSLAEAKKVIDDFYSSKFYKSHFKLGTSSYLNKKKRIIYLIIKLRLLFPLEIFIGLFKKIKKEQNVDIIIKI